jgi:hypothetical protein
VEHTDYDDAAAMPISGGRLNLKSMGFDGMACTPRIRDLRDRSGEVSRSWKDHRTTTDATTRTQAMTATAEDEEDPMKINLYVEDTVLPLVTGRRFRGR